MLHVAHQTCNMKEHAMAFCIAYAQGHRVKLVWVHGMKEHCVWCLNGGL